MGRSFKISVCFSGYISININLMPRLSVVYITICILHCEEDFFSKGYFHLCPRMDFLQTLHINNSFYTNYENAFIELDS